MRVALFGGTFDPIHRGHLVIAASAAKAFSLDRVVFAPTGRQPLKSEGPTASFEERLAMVQLAVDAADRRFVASSVDGPRPDGMPNFTVDLLDGMRRARPMDELFAISGADSFLTLRQWKEPDRLLAAAEWIVVSRPGFPLGEGDFAELDLTVAQRARVHLLRDVKEEVSATDLRRRLALGEDCSELLPAAVERYVRERALYR